MKFLCGLVILSLSICSVAEGTGTSFIQKHISGFKDFLAKYVSHWVEYKLHTYLRHVDGDQTVKDPMSLYPISICGLNTMIPLANISLRGDFSMTDPEVTGLSKLISEIKIQHTNHSGKLNIDIELTLPRIVLQSSINAKIIIEQNVSHIELEGEGQLIASASDVFLKFHATGMDTPEGNFRLLDMDVDFGFKGFKLDSHGFTSAKRIHVILSNMGKTIQRVFDLIWTDETKRGVNQVTRCIVDDMISQCSTQKMLAGDFANCYKREAKKDCSNTKGTKHAQQLLFEASCVGVETGPSSDEIDVHAAKEVNDVEELAKSDQEKIFQTIESTDIMAADIPSVGTHSLMCPLMICIFSTMVASSINNLL